MVPREIELKFELDPDAVAQVRSRIEVRHGPASSSRRLVSVYYDTADHDLAAQGVTLRIRSGAGDQLIQTVKRGDGPQATLFRRDEWEVPVVTHHPDLAAFATTPAGLALGAPDIVLVPRFETKVDRVAWTVAGDGLVIEIALDAGQVETPTAQQSFAEVELELKQGRPGDLFAVLHDLDGIAGLRPGFLTKSERGYRLLRNKPRKAQKAEPVRVDKAMTAADGVQAILRACLRHFGLNIPLVVTHRSAEGLHQARVGLRRLRSALSLFKTLLSDGEFLALKADLQMVSRRLGEARNLDVYLAEAARPAAERAPADPGLAAFLLELERRRTLAYDDAVTCLQSPECDRLLRRLVEWVEAGPWLTDPDPLRATMRDMPVRRLAAQALEKRRRRLIRQGHQLTRLEPHARHEVRIEAKKLRYACEFFAGLATRPKRQERHRLFIAGLEDLQEALGQLNDIATGQEFALSFAPGPGRDAVPEALQPAAQIHDQQQAREAALLETAEASHARLGAAKRFWSAWHR